MPSYQPKITVRRDNDTHTTRSIILSLVVVDMVHGGHHINAYCTEYDAMSTISIQ